MHHTHPPTHCLPLREYSCTVRHGCVRCDLHLSPCKHKNMLGVCFNECAPTYTLVYLCGYGSAWVLGKMHWCMEAYTRTRCVCVWGLSVPMWCVWRAIWSPLPCRGPCEVLSAWPLWSPVATEGLLHSTSSPGSRPQKRKFGSLKWRGCSRAIYRALYRSSATHDIPYENQCVCGACGVVCVWVLGVDGGTVGG